MFVDGDFIMSLAKNKRESKRQLGQFLTPDDVARKIVEKLELNESDVVLEPSFGKGVFIFAYIDKLIDLGVDAEQWAKEHVFGCELDPLLFKTFSERWKYGDVSKNFVNGDFFRYEMPSYKAREYFKKIKGKYDLILGNPPFGGTIDSEIQDQLDAIYGFRNGGKIKKETYAFFIVKCLDLLKPGGRLVFICSDTMLSINTMSGLRRFLMETCRVKVEHIPGEFEETDQPMILLSLYKGGTGVSVFGNELSIGQISKTPNSSWTITDDMAKYFTGKTLGDFVTATSGMTIGKNEYFLREVDKSGYIEEPYDFEIYDRPITLKRELENARLGKLSESRRIRIMEVEERGETSPAVKISLKESPQRIKLPHPDYAPYNKAVGGIVYSPMRFVVYWKDNGKALYTFKKSGPWYLHGVGGKPFFGKEGLTWQLISSRLNVKYLESGFILDSGAPAAFLKDGVNHDELYFIIGWCLTDTCNKILKTVLNHTRNIQSKDFERIPYPVWVSEENKINAISLVKNLIDRAMKGEKFTYESNEVSSFNVLYRMDNVNS